MSVQGALIILGQHESRSVSRSAGTALKETVVQSWAWMRTGNLSQRSAQIRLLPITASHFPHSCSKTSGPHGLDLLDVEPEGHVVASLSLRGDESLDGDWSKELKLLKEIATCEAGAGGGGESPPWVSPAHLYWTKLPADVDSSGSRLLENIAVPEIKVSR